MESLGNDQPDRLESGTIDESMPKPIIEDYPTVARDHEASDEQDGLSEQFGMFYD